MTKTALMPSSDGFDRPWTYTSRSLNRYYPRGAAVLFTCTGLLGLPFALFGIYFGLAMMLEFSVAALAGAGLLTLIGWGLVLLAGNLRYLFGGRSAHSHLHWISTAAYHAVLGALGAVIAVGGGSLGGLLLLAPYALMTWVAYRSHSIDKAAALLETEVAHARLTHG